MRSVVLMVALASVAVACSSGGSPSSSQGAGSPTLGDPTTDKLAQILTRGTIVLYTDPAYPPQSYAVKGAARLANTKCLPNQMTGPQMAGYDVDTGKLVAKALGVEPCFVFATWPEVTAGNWNDRWDIAYGSGAINTDRMKRLWMTQPYRAEPQRFFVATNSPYQVPGDLNGKRIGVCASCTVEYYLKGSLVIPNLTIVQKVQNPQIVAFETEPPGLKVLSTGGLDAFLCAEAVGEQGIKDGLKIRVMKGEAFTMYLTGFVDKHSGLDVKPFTDRVNQIISQALADGSLRALSMKYFGKDYATGSNDYSVAALNQSIT